ncbi:hypothetical protein [Paracidovorax valerianellae]|uniref:Uncharacterized protein n=1 Tax=Paracidovorax valerianellae TaxID=187868 RepID=A0A1G6IK59_9BURK|nr:hypothetical protein [Paracidovorax valerianellae]MDA8447886.1 hypothetical protein [Paracidovorax valerianellae]SDC06790.1 hypothetical protein SAMN05192589_101188 [Paracidovorax valerianellae]
MKSPDLERVAETHFMIRPTLNSALKNSVLTAEGQARSPNCSTYFDVWTKSYSDRFFDMGTLIRAASSVETSLRDYYAQKKGYLNLSQLRQDPSYKKNIFQRVMPWHGNDGAVALIKTVNVDITVIPELPIVQELVLHRHLYAHNLGVIDDEYIKKLKRLTSIDLQANPQVAAQYPAQDVFWFEPLDRLPVFIEAVRSFVRALK